jgi:hypothetical protein
VELDAACIVCNWVNDVFWPWGPFGAFGAAGAGFFGGGFFGGSGGGESDDSGGDETIPPYSHDDPWDEGHRRWYEERQREESEEYEREREADRQERADRRRQEFDNRPWSDNPLLDVSESVRMWAQDLFGLDPDNPEGKGTAPTAHLM